MAEATGGAERGLSVEATYRRRLGRNKARRALMWRTLCACWFQRFVPAESRVLELGAGHCEFINAIGASARTAVDVNEDTRIHAVPGIRVIRSSCTAVPQVTDGSQDVVLMSNLLEHLTRPEIVQTLAECRRVLAPGGRLLILQPNIRFIPRDYWMFFDHVTPVDDRALCEALELAGFRVEINVPRFLPYTTASRLPVAAWLIRLYLRLPILWRVFGGQAFIVAAKPAAAGPGERDRIADPCDFLWDTRFQDMQHAHR